MKIVIKELDIRNLKSSEDVANYIDDTLKPLKESLKEAIKRQQEFQKMSEKEKFSEFINSLQDILERNIKEKDNTVIGKYDETENFSSIDNEEKLKDVAKEPKGFQPRESIINSVFEKAFSSLEKSLESVKEEEENVGIVDEVLTLNEVAEYLKMSPGAIAKLVHQSKIPHYCLRSVFPPRIRFRKSDIDGWLDDHFVADEEMPENNSDTESESISD